MSRIFDTKCRPNKSHNCQLRKGSQKFPQNWNWQKLKLTSSGVHNDQIFCLVMNMKIKISTSKMMTRTMIMLTTMMMETKVTCHAVPFLGDTAGLTDRDDVEPLQHGHHPHHLHHHHHHMVIIHKTFINTTTMSSWRWSTYWWSSKCRRQQEQRWERRGDQISVRLQP